MSDDTIPYSGLMRGSEGWVNPRKLDIYPECRRFMESLPPETSKIMVIKHLRENVPAGGDFMSLALAKKIVDAHLEDKENEQINTDFGDYDD